MKSFDTCYIGGQWVRAKARPIQVLYNPATDIAYGEVALGTAADADAAVEAARRAFPDFAATTKADRLALLRRALEIYKRRYDEFVAAITLEMGAPVRLSRTSQAAAGLDHLEATIAAFEHLALEHPMGDNVTLLHEPIGVCALITPWNWPINQIVSKVAPALAAGCTMVLKPSELTPFSAHLFAEVLEEAGVPPGVFNLVHGEGKTVGTALASHRGVDMVSFTGSTAAGVQVAINAAATVKRVAQELGGKSPNILLPDADFDESVSMAVEGCMENTGQSCNAPTRLLVPAARYGEVVERAVAAAKALKVGNPNEEETDIGPIVSRIHVERVRNFIKAGADEGATLATGGVEPITNLQGYFVTPTIFSDVTPGMRIAREEIFGPVLVVLPYRNEAEAIALANDTPYGLAAYVSSADTAHAMAVARQLRAGQVHVNGASPSAAAPFGGYRQSGNGREGGAFGLHDFLELKAVAGV